MQATGPILPSLLCVCQRETGPAGKLKENTEGNKTEDRLPKNLAELREKKKLCQPREKMKKEKKDVRRFYAVKDFFWPFILLRSEII